MDILKKLFPLSFKFTGSVANIVIGIIIYVVVGIIGSVAIFLTGIIPVPFVGLLCSILGVIVDLYVVGGIVLLFLSHFKVIK